MKDFITWGVTRCKHEEYNGSGHVTYFCRKPPKVKGYCWQHYLVPHFYRRASAIQERQVMRWLGRPFVISESTDART